jgi:hypothetical protein
VQRHVTAKDGRRAKVLEMMLIEWRPFVLQIGRYSHHPLGPIDQVVARIFGEKSVVERKENSVAVNIVVLFEKATNCTFQSLVTYPWESAEPYSCQVGDLLASAEYSFAVVSADVEGSAGVI